MRIEYDPAKNEKNIRERGLSFERAGEFDFATALTIPDLRHDYGEVRYRALGWLGRELHALVYTIRGDAIRVISLRRANERERRRYAEAGGSGTD